MIDLYTWTTPNGRKVSIMLEECALPYTVRPINIGKNVDQFTPDYVLQHENIHFAIVELVARDLNRRAPELIQRMSKRAATGEAALAAAKQEFNAEFELAIQRTLERNRSFDHETSLGFKPERQEAWAQLIEQELADTAQHASPSAPPPDGLQQR